jgi:hypothetical protein
VASLTERSRAWREARLKDRVDDRELNHLRGVIRAPKAGDIYRSGTHQISL